MSTTVCASSGVCLAMSLRVEAAMRLMASSGSRRHNTSRGTAPASTTDWDNAARQENKVECSSMCVRVSSVNVLFQTKNLTYKDTTGTWAACPSYVHCAAQWTPEPRRRPPSPRGQTPPGRELGHPPRRRPPQPGTAPGSVWPLHAAQTLLLSYKTSARKHTHVNTPAGKSPAEATWGFILQQSERGRRERNEILTFCEAREWTSWGRMSSFTTASARSSLWSARRPTARAAVCWMLGTTSNNRGRSRATTPAGGRRLNGSGSHTCPIPLIVSPTRILEDFYVLRSGCQISNILHKLHPWFLILLENCKVQRDSNSVELWSGVFLSRCKPLLGSHLEWSVFDSLLLLCFVLNRFLRVGFVSGFSADFLLVRSLLGGVVVKCCRGNRQEAECSVHAAEDRLLTDASLCHSRWSALDCKYAQSERSVGVPVSASAAFLVPQLTFPQCWY